MDRRLGSFHDHGLNTRDEIKTKSRVNLTARAIGVSEAKSQEGRKFFYRLTMGYLINILPADFNSITG